MKIKISIAQMAVKQSDPEENLKKGEAMAAEASRGKSDIVCFPEMWTTGFGWTYIARAARESDGVLERIAGVARRYGIWIVGSALALDEEGRPSNTSILFDREGKRAGTYRKIHLFGAIGEDKNLSPGRSLCIADTPWGKSALAICYDIRFPELFRAYAVKGAKIVFLSAAFPYPKLEQWRVLARARAIEDQMYVVCANRIGVEDHGQYGKTECFGSSLIVDPLGDIVLEAPEKAEGLFTADIDMDMVDDVRSKAGVLKDIKPESYR